MNEPRRTTKVTKVGASLAVLGVMLVAASNASADPPPIPQEAFTACEGKAAGDACSVTFHEHTIEGTCAARPEGGALFCRPSGPPPSH
jgi:hypothetical protein